MITLVLSPLLYSCSFGHVFLKESTPNDFLYREYGAPTGVIITGLKNTNIQILNIPTSINGMSVRGIEDGAFKEAKKVVEIVLNQTGSSTPTHIGVFFGKNRVSTSYYAVGYYIPKTLRKVSVVNTSFNGPGLKDVTSLTEVVISMNGSFSQEWLSGTSNLKKITISQAGLTDRKDNLELHFGSYFGTKEYPNSYKVDKYDYYIPNGLEEIILTQCEEIKEFAFEGVKSVKKITLPSTLVSIGYGAFFDMHKITTIEIPQSVSSLSPESFFGMTSLKSFTVDKNNPYYTAVDGVLMTKSEDMIVAYPNTKSGKSYTIPSSVQAIKPGAFSESVFLEEIKLHKSNPHFISLDGVLYNSDNSAVIAYPPMKTATNYTIPEGVFEVKDMAFRQVKKLENITLPATLSTIGVSSFAHAEKLKSIQGGNTLREIRAFAFYNANQLQSFSIPMTLVSINPYAFYKMLSLESFTVHPQNPNYQSKDGILFDKSGLTLLHYPPNKPQTSYVTESSTQTIHQRAFAYAQNLENLEITSNVHMIGIGALVNMKALKTVVIPHLGSCDVAVYANGYSCLTFNFLLTGVREATYYGNTIQMFPLEVKRFLAVGTLPSLETIRVTLTTVYTIGHLVGMPNLKRVILPSSVREIKDTAFIHDSEFQAIEIQSGSRSYKSINGVLFTYDGKTLLMYPKGKIDESYSIPLGTTTISYYAFYGTKNLKTVFIPNTVTASDGVPWFYYAKSIEEIDVSPTHPKYSSVDGVLFSKDLRILLKYPEGKKDTEYFIPRGTFEIMGLAFQNNEVLRVVTIPSSVLRVAYWAFMNCPELVIYGTQVPGWSPHWNPDQLPVFGTGLYVKKD